MCMYVRMCVYVYVFSSVDVSLYHSMFLFLCVSVRIFILIQHMQYARKFMYVLRGREYLSIYDHAYLSTY